MKPEHADKEPIAYHELAHMLVFKFFGYRVTSVEVGEEFGCTSLPNQTVNGFHYIIALCSGKAAVDRWYGWKAQSDENWRKSEDHRKAYRVALRLSQDDLLAATQLIRWAEMVAEKIVERHWDQFPGPARLLVETGKLNVT